MTLLGFRRRKTALQTIHYTLYIQWPFRSDSLAKQSIEVGIYNVSGAFSRVPSKCTPISAPPNSQRPRHSLTISHDST